MQLRRGFKKEANEIANEVRTELLLRPIDPLNPWRLADHLEIPVEPLSSYQDTAPRAFKHFCESLSGQSEFSALTIIHF